MQVPSSPLAAALAVLAAGLLAGCAPSARAEARSQGRLLVVTSAYPVQFVAERVGGARTHVVDLARPGAEPHELELTPQDVAAVEDADLVVYLGGFQPAVDRAVASSAGAAPSTSPRPPASTSPRHRRTRARGTLPRSRTGRWTPTSGSTRRGSPTSADAVAARLGQVAPADAAGIHRPRRRAARRADRAWTPTCGAGLTSCRSRSLVTGHAAFGYFAARYGLHQVGVTGLDPEAEPDAAELARVAEFVRREGVATVYTETLAARTSPGPRRRDAARGPRCSIPSRAGRRSGDYLSAMRADLVTLRAGQGCS